MGGRSPYHLHVHVLLTVLGEYFEPSSQLFSGQAEWCVMSERCSPAGRQWIVGHREIRCSCKIVTKPSRCLKFDGDGAWWCDAERLDNLHDAPGRPWVIAWSRSLSDIRRLGSVETTTFDDLLSVDEFDDGRSCTAGVEMQRASSSIACRRSSRLYGSIRTRNLGHGETTSRWEPKTINTRFDSSERSRN